ncbi:hypothetical protein H6P81_021676 [Aristolochia fimbriata]|uniref:Uncharacterized protein n=1 Tax=Aristolochia fimbriata TaxID=158543 RepID=A0AAV7DP97_ARIFI|nr:hypothetical protein H6P81_021676 [Aristolochia fimbriata]
MDPELWEKVLSPDNEFRRQLFDQVVSTSLPESKSPEQVSAAVKAINADPSRVMVIYRLDNFDGPAVGDVAVKAALYDEAFVGKVQLCEGLVSDAIESFIRAEDATQFLDDIWASEDANVYHDLVRLDDIKEFILMPNVASLPNVGDRLCDEASKLGKQIGQRHGKKFALPVAILEEFRLAQIFRLSIIVQVDELEEVSDYYQNRGCFNELISFMESGLVLERAHMAIFFTDFYELVMSNSTGKRRGQYDEFDNAATTIEHPNLINDPINVLVLRVDLTLIVDIIRKAGHLCLVKPYMVTVQQCICCE